MVEPPIWKIWCSSKLNHFPSFQSRKNAKNMPKKHHPVASLKLDVPLPTYPLWEIPKPYIGMGTSCYGMHPIRPHPAVPKKSKVHLPQWRNQGAAIQKHPPNGTNGLGLAKGTVILVTDSTELTETQQALFPAGIKKLIVEMLRFCWDFFQPAWIQSVKGQSSWSISFPAKAPWFSMAFSVAICKTHWRSSQGGLLPWLHSTGHRPNVFCTLHLVTWSNRCPMKIPNNQLISILFWPPLLGQKAFLFVFIIEGWHFLGCPIPCFSFSTFQICLHTDPLLLHFTLSLAKRQNEK